MSASEEFESLLVERAESWLGRPLRADDGASGQDIERGGGRLGFPVPPELSAVHRRIGRVEELMGGFERFRAPDRWEVADDRLLFLDENQGACSWGVDREGRVWAVDDDGFRAEDLSLADFLSMVLPCQLAQGGWPHCGERTVRGSDLRPELARIASLQGWPRLADRNGLVVYGAGGHLLWALEPTPDEAAASIFLSSRDEDAFARLSADLGFEEL